MLLDSHDYKSINNYNGLVVYNTMESHVYPCPLYSDPIFKQCSSQTRRMGNQYSVVRIIRLGRVELNAQNGRIRQIGTQYSIVQKVGLG